MFHTHFSIYRSTLSDTWYLRNFPMCISRDVGVFVRKTFRNLGTVQSVGTNAAVQVYGSGMMDVNRIPGTGIK